MVTKITRKGLLAALVILALLLYPVVAPQAFVIFILTLIFLYAIVTKYYNFLMGYGGIFFLSPMIFMGISGYLTGFMALRVQANPVLAIAIGTAAATASSLAFSLLSMRLRGLYMALYSFIFVLLLHEIVVNDAEFVRRWTGGSVGYYGLPEIAVAGVEFHKFMAIPFYYVTLAIFIVSLVVLHKLLNSKFGVRFQGLRDAETYASTLGVNPFSAKIYAFAISALFMGLAGGIFTYYFFAINPAIFTIPNVLLFLAMAVLGGIGTLWGPFVGTLILIPLNEILKTYGAYRMIVVGLVLIAVVMLAPRGIVGTLEDRLLSKRAAGTLSVLPKMLLKKAMSQPSPETDG